MRPVSKYCVHTTMHTGLQNKTSCSKCRRRKGYSAFRKSSKQRGTLVRTMYSWVHDNPEGLRRSTIKAVREKLHRWGFNAKRRCCLHVVTDVDKVLVRIPERDEVFPCLDYRDRMHSMFIFLWRVITEAMHLVGLTPKSKQILDRRLAAVCDRRCFRNDMDQAYRRQKSVFDGTGMTASDKVCMMFLLPHVLGHKPDFILPEVATPLLNAIAHVQLMLIACRGLRLYTKSELEVIFDEGYLVLFRCLETIRLQDFERRMQAHREDPVKYPQPKRFKYQTRYNRLYPSPRTSRLTLNLTVLRHDLPIA